MNKEVRELRKAGSMAGIEVSWFGDIISSKTRKFYNSLNKIKGCNLDVFQKVLKECRKNNISDITVLKCDALVGNYGRVLSDAEIINERHIGTHVEAPIKYIYNILRGIYNIHNATKYLDVLIPTNDGKALHHMFYIPEEYRIIEYGNNSEDKIVVMANGQCFDIGHSYYYSKQDSRELKKYIKEHGYSGPNDFYEYLDPYSDYEESEGSPE